MIGSLIAGIIVAAAGATAGLWGALKDDKEARESLQGRLNRNEAEYQQAKEKAELEFKQAKEEAARNAAQMELQADLTDKSLNQTEKTISTDFNATIDQLYLSQEEDAYNWNTQAMQAGSAEGASYAALGASGVRAGSSMSDAIMMESATNASQLQFAQDSKRRSDSNSLASVLSNLAGSRVDIQQNRIGADVTRGNAAYLRNSFEEGGSQYNLYQNRLDTLQTQRDFNAEELNKEWKKHSGWNSFANAFIAFNTMGAKGFSTGYNVGSSFYNASGAN